MFFETVEFNCCQATYRGVVCIN